MKIYSCVKDSRTKKIKIFCFPIYRKKVIKDSTNRYYCFGLISSKINSYSKKYYFCGIRVYLRTNKLKKLEEHIIGHINKKFQEYKVKQHKMFSIYALHQQVFPQFKNKHQGEILAIIGCGPTLNYFSAVDNIHYVALNRALDYQKVKFDYFFCTDGRDDMRKYLKKYSQYNCTKFYGQHFNFVPPVGDRGCANIPESDVVRDKAYRFYSNAFDIEFYPDISTEPLMDYGSIAFCALHFALWTHPKRIYLIGLDCNNLGSFNNHSQGYLNENMVLQGYKKVKTFAQTYYPDVEIISVNPVGLIGMFYDVYTESYLVEHPEIKTECIQLIDSTGEIKCKNR